MVQQRVCTAVQRLIRHDLVPGHHRGPQSGGDGAHAGGRGHGGLAALQGGQLLLNSAQSGVAQTGVDVAGFLEREACGALFGALEDIGSRLVDGQRT